MRSLRRINPLLAASRRALSTLASSIALYGSSAYGQGPTITALGDLTGGAINSEAYAVSDDGTVVAGQSSSTNSGSNYNEAFKWTAATGMVGLGFVSGGTYSSIARAMSRDGSVIVGEGYDATGSLMAFRYSGGAMQSLYTQIDQYGGRRMYQAFATNGDGSVVCGYGGPWTNAGGVQNISSILAFAISADGTMTAGRGGNYEAATYTSSGGVKLLTGQPTGPGLASEALGMTGDGTKFVGSANNNQACAWTTSGYVSLGSFPGGSTTSKAYTVSTDGQTVAGFASYPTKTAAAVWRGGQIIDLAIYLTTAGVNMSHWQGLNEVRAISSDGTYLVGSGTTSAHKGEAYLVHIPAFGTPAATTFASWQQSKFTVGELADPTKSGPNAIYGSDGLCNLLKYAFGFEPKTNITTGLPSTTTSATEWIYTYTRPTTTTDLTYTVEVSTTLGRWTTSGVTHELVSIAGGTATWRARYPLASSPSAFFHLKIN